MIYSYISWIYSQFKDNRNIAYLKKKMLTVWSGMVCNIVHLRIVIIDYHSEITCDTPVLNVVAIWRTSCNVPVSTTRIYIPDNLLVGLIGYQWVWTWSHNKP